MTKQYTLTNEQFIALQDKYEKLIWKIASKIGGDRQANGVEDNFQEVSCAAVEATESFLKKNSLQFDEAIEQEGFDKYIKTVMWNRKNRIGAKLSKRFGITNTTSIERHLMPEWMKPDKKMESADLEPASSIEVSSMFSDIEFNEVAQNILDYILNDPKAHHSASGKLNFIRMERKLGLTRRQLDSAMESLRIKLRDYDPKGIS